MEGNNVGKEEQCDFFSRLVGLPVIQSVMKSTMEVYNRAKESNELVKLALNSAEKSMAIAAERAKPLVVKFESPIVLANNLACMTLGKLEETMPIIKGTPEEIVAETKKLYDETVVQPALARYNKAKSYGVEKATAVRDYTLANAHVLMDTKYGHQIVGTLDYLVVKADSYMDSYLPPIKCHGQPDEPTMNENGSTIEKVTTLSKKVSRRVTCHAVVIMEDTIKRTNEILARLHSSVELVKKNVMEYFSKASDKIHQMWDSLKKGTHHDETKQ